MKKSFSSRLANRVKSVRLARQRKLASFSGAAVELAPLPGDPPFLQAMLKLAKPRDWPRDFALNHGHYVKGHPKK